jgi:hypothetical protein
MPRSIVRRAAALSLLALLLAAPWSTAEPRQHEVHPRKSAQLWSWLTAVWGEIGCGIDPHGGVCRGAASAGQADIGCGIDPGGRCGQ